MKPNRYSPRPLMATVGLAGLTLGLLTSSYATSGSKVSLAATIQNQPAFVAANWKVFDMNNHQNLVAHLNGHSGTLDMQPGYYLALLEYANLHKQTTFRVESGKSVRVQIALD